MSYYEEQYKKRMIDALEQIAAELGLANQIALLNLDEEQTARLFAEAEAAQEQD